MKITSLTQRVSHLFGSAVSIGAFKHVSTIYSEDLKMHLHQFAHSKTDARIYHFENSDPDNAYASIVKTYVQNDKGCPHILEHLACCGSNKYPIRDPFFNMIKRSVNTYMNAWTGDDFTSYPFSSANPKDWQNLYKVYLDMSLKPLLNELDFRQEGWRYELNSQGVRQLKGIVLNEMKGAYQDSDRQLIKQINQELFKGTPFIYDSGGRPHQIVNLEYSELIKMYQHYYHPSNMSFFFYGNNNIGRSLEYLSQEYLNNYQNQSHLYNKVNLIPEPVQNKHKTIISTTSETNNISINYFLGLTDSFTPVQTLSLRIIAYLLLEKSNALLYQKFIESGIAQNIGFSMFNEAKVSTFTLTLKGIYPDYECELFQKQFRQVLQDMIEKGVEMERVKQFVHQFQVNLLTPRENNGIRVLEETMNLMNHRLDFTSYMNPRPSLEQAVTKLKQKDFVQTLLNKFFLNNKQMVVVRQLLAEKEQQEQPIVSKVQMQDSKIKEQQEQLNLRQNQKVDPNILPILNLKDIIKPKRVSPTLVNKAELNGKVYQQYHVKIDENINYYRLIFNYDQVSQQFLEKATLWTHTINRVISTHSYNYNELTSSLANHTANFNVFSTIGEKADLNIVFEFSCLKKNINTAFSLLEQIILVPKFEKEHTLNAYRAFGNEVIESLVQNPMAECVNEGASQLTTAGAILNTYQRIKQGLKIVGEQNVQGLYQISMELTKCPNIRLLEHSNQERIKSPILIDKLLKFESQRMKSFEPCAPTFSKAVTYAYKVNFCAQQFVAPKYLSKQHAHINLLLELLQQDYLHPLIREKGGAYGSNARIRNGGTISLSSYLDPNSVETFKVFETSIKDLLSKDSLDDGKLLEAKIKQFGEIDRIKVPQNEGVNQLIRNYTEQQFDSFRQTLKNSHFSEIVESGRQYMLNKPTSRCIFGRQAPEGFTEEKLKDYLL